MLILNDNKAYVVEQALKRYFDTVTGDYAEQQIKDLITEVKDPTRSVVWYLQFEDDEGALDILTDIHTTELFSSEQAALNRLAEIIMYAWDLIYPDDDEPKPNTQKELIKHFNRNMWKWSMSYVIHAQKVIR